MASALSKADAKEELIANISNAIGFFEADFVRIMQGPQSPQRNPGKVVELLTAINLLHEARDRARI